MKLEPTENDWRALSRQLPGQFPDNLKGWQYMGNNQFRIRAGTIGARPEGKSDRENILVTIKK